jgi:hypothetical protein
MAYCSSETISLSSSSGRDRVWFIGVSDLLESMGIQMDHLPPFRYSLDALGHLLPVEVLVASKDILIISILY